MANIGGRFFMENPIQYVFLEAAPNHEDVLILNYLIKQTLEKRKPITVSSIQNLLSNGGAVMIARDRKSRRIVGFGTMTLSIRIDGPAWYRIQDEIVDDIDIDHERDMIYHQIRESLEREAKRRGIELQTVA